MMPLFGSAVRGLAPHQVACGSTLMNVNLQVAGTYTFDAIAAILVGGSAVTGGWGSVGRTVIGALIIATVTDMLLLVGASTGMQILVKGLIVTVVVVLLHLSRRERRSP